ncbi:MAG: class 1 fructose-bisphosphatase [Thiolinea sp.]
MKQTTTLDQYLRQWAGNNEYRQMVEITVNSLIESSVTIAELASLGSLSGALADTIGTTNEDGDEQRLLDLQAHELLLEACHRAPVTAVGSEESAEVIHLDNPNGLIVVMDPLDGSSNIETNAPTGTIFSLYPQPQNTCSETDDVALQKGNAQLAAGYVIYGTQTALALTVGAGTQIFILDRRTNQYLLAHENVQIPMEAREYAVNASNHDFWHDAIQNYVDDCITGYADHKQKFNMRWVASLVAEAHRIFARGGVFLYPGDSRKGYEMGRLRLVYEANTMAFLMEQAGGAAIDGTNRILDIQPEYLHQRTPLIMGSAANVDQVKRYQNFEEGGRYRQGKAPLFGSRGIFSSGRGNF